MTDDQTADDPASRPYDRAMAFIRRLYERQGIELGPSTPGDMVSAEAGRDISNAELAPLFVFVDELTALLRLLSLGLITTAPNSKADSALFYRVCVKAMSNLASIRSLCALGFDGNARIQLRLHYETMVLWSRLRIDADARRAFHDAVTPKAANHFWHTHLRDRKSEKALIAFSSESGGWIGAEEPFAGRTATLLGVSSHPSHLEMRFNAEEDWNGPGDHIVVRGPVASSHFTLGTAIWASVFPFFIPPLGFMQVETPTGWIPPEAAVFKAPSWDADYYERLQKMILGLFLFSQPILGNLGAKSPEASEADSAAGLSEK